jgi:hypothetical protein
VLLSMSMTDVAMRSDATVTLPKLAACTASTPHHTVAAADDAADTKAAAGIKAADAARRPRPPSPPLALVHWFELQMDHETVLSTAPPGFPAEE